MKREKGAVNPDPCAACGQWVFISCAILTCPKPVTVVICLLWWHLVPATHTAWHVSISTSLSLPLLLSPPHVSDLPTFPFFVYICVFPYLFWWTGGWCLAFAFGAFYPQRPSRYYYSTYLPPTYFQHMVWFFYHTFPTPFSSMLVSTYYPARFCIADSGRKRTTLVLLCLILRMRKRQAFLCAGDGRVTGGDGGVAYRTGRQNFLRAAA